MPIRNLNLLTLVVTIMVLIDASVMPVILLWSSLFPSNYLTNVSPIAVSVDSAFVGLKLLTFIVFARWIYVAGANLVAAGFDDLEFTPGSRIWWFAVPIASLFKPFQGMRELWNASHGNPDGNNNNSLVSLWWALWLGTSLVIIIGVIAEGPDSGLTFRWIQGAMLVARAAVVILMIRAIAEAQTKLTGEGLAEVFT